MSGERTFLMLKPDAVQRGLIGEIIKRFEQKGFKLVAMKMTKVGLLYLFFSRVHLFRPQGNGRSPQTALHRPSKQGILRRPRKIHVFAPCRSNGRLNSQKRRSSFTLSSKGLARQRSRENSSQNDGGDQSSKSPKCNLYGIKIF